MFPFYLTFKFAIQNYDQTVLYAIVFAYLIILLSEAKEALKITLAAGRRKDSVDSTFQHSTFNFNKSQKNQPNMDIPLMQTDGIQNITRDPIKEYTEPFKQLSLIPYILSYMLMGYVSTCLSTSFSDKLDNVFPITLNSI